MQIAFIFIWPWKIHSEQKKNLKNLSKVQKIIRKFYDLSAFWKNIKYEIIIIFNLILIFPLKRANQELNFNLSIFFLFLKKLFSFQSVISTFCYAMLILYISPFWCDFQTNHMCNWQPFERIETHLSSRFILINFWLITRLKVIKRKEKSKRKEFSSIWVH